MSAMLDYDYRLRYDYNVRALYYGDNLDILRKHIGDESVDLIYLDPPFNSKIDYQLRVRVQSGDPPKPAVVAFSDIWKWNEEAYHQFMDWCSNERVRRLMQGFVESLGRNEMTAYLVMMAPRLVELHRVLKPTGSLYLHCDPTASHYLKVMMDMIFGPRNFRNEIVWKRTCAHNRVKRWGPVHDVLLFYTKSNAYTWNTVYTDYDRDYVKKFFRYEDEQGRYRLHDLTGAGISHGDSGRPWKGVDPTRVGRSWAVPNALVESVVGKERAAEMTVQEKLDALEEAGFILWPERGSVPRYKRYLSMNPGTIVQDVITNIQPISAHAKERLGYPTQKPLALLERIIQASSNEGDVVLDPFCGCGTTLVAAEKLGRNWTGIDNSHVAISLAMNRLSDMLSLVAGKDYEVVGDVPLVTAPQNTAAQTGEVCEGGVSGQPTLPLYAS